MENLSQIINGIKNIAEHEAERARLLAALDGVYGKEPRRPEHLKVALGSPDTGFAAGAATFEELVLIADYGTCECEIPVTSVIPRVSGPHPAFIHICEYGGAPNRHQPTEELTELGFAVFTLHATDALVSSVPSERDCGMLSRCASLVSRIVDYVTTLDSVDKSKIAVIGHEHLGTAALLCAARDSRIGYAVCNGSGVHINRRNMTREMLPSLFSDKCEDLGDTARALLALIAPRRVMLGCSESDMYASASDVFSLASTVSDIYFLYGMSAPQEYSDATSTDGIHFHKRTGECYLSRRDWRTYAEYVLGK